jgi:hypothetical protein
MFVCRSKNIADFMLVFLFCIFGYGIYFCGLYGTLPGSIYSTPYKTFLSLFGAALNNYDLSSFDDTYFAIVGSFIMVAYITFTSILLLNLLIARMSSAHDIIADRSQQEWSFIQASLLTEYAVMEERNPLCVLPAPFNVITILAYLTKHTVASSHSMMMTSFNFQRSNSAYIISSPRGLNQTVHNRVDIVSTVANVVIRIMFAFPIMLFSLLSILGSYKLAIELDGFEFEMVDDELVLRPVFKCHDYLGFFGGNGSFHGYKNIDTIQGEAIDFKNAEKVLSNIKQYIFKNKTNEKIGYLSKEELDEFMLSRPFVEALKDEDEIHESYLKKNPVRSFFRPIFCIPIVLWEYFHCFRSDTISYEKDESNENVNVETKNILLNDDDDGDAMGRNRQLDCILKIYEEEEVIDLLRLLNMRSETVDRIETVKLHLKKLQGDVDSVKQQLEEMKTSMDASSRASVELISDIFAKNMDELRYLIHK